MSTIIKNTGVTSNTLMSNQECSVNLLPSDKGEIRFLKEGACVKAGIDNVVSTQHCTVLGNEQINIALVEHFMAALAICNIDSLDVEVSESEMPILDGSAKSWVDLFESAGIKKTKNRSYIVTEPVYFIHNQTTIAVLPADKFSVTYCVNFTNGDLNNRWLTFDGENIDEITNARTFGYYKDLEKFQAMGLALGVTDKNIVGLTEDAYTTELRSQYEPIKHKILDLIGDFYLTGYNPFNLKAQIIAKNAGHTSHVAVAKLLRPKIIEEKKND